ncbi:hypothetical protein [Citrobacter sp. MNAZ 1397]|uniref:hypothetical protein n=1 Tax=Citrobacter sp. MNAZ 1397 TaxID=2911205 RepID=UPI002025D83C|nr:hypothetical protein [Citrobacter sp. MNAZ 1397]MCL9674582.1 hypothetical protein [Citrobacter sp. MNAZ 1397]
MTKKLKHIKNDGFCFKNRFLVNFRYSSGALQITLSSTQENKIDEIDIVFDWVHSFRVTDEGDLLKLQDELNGQMLTGIYLVEGSEYLIWFNNQSANIHDNDEIVHYLIVTSDDVIDVLSSVKPLITYCE